jgi:hypothetical protein
MYPCLLTLDLQPLVPYSWQKTQAQVVCYYFIFVYNSPFDLYFSCHSLFCFVLSGLAWTSGSPGFQFGQRPVGSNFVL